MLKTNVDANEMLNAASGLVPEKAIKQVPGEPAPAVDPAVDPAPVASAAPVADPIPAAPITVKSPLGDQTFGATPVADVKLTSFEDVVAFAKEQAGLELKSVQDFVPLFGQLKELQKSAAETAALQKTVETYESKLNNLPKDVSLILSAALNGEDHMKVITKLQQKASFDFEKPVTAHDDIDLINHYTGRHYTQDTLDALEPSAQEALLDAAKLKYAADQNEYTGLQTSIKSSAEKRQKDFQTSVDFSISQMLASNPGMDKAAAEKVKQVMAYDLSGSLFTKDQNYLPDAAEKIAYMLYGKQIVAAQQQTIGDIVKRMKAQGETSATEKILMRSDKPVLKGGGALGDQNNLKSIVQKETAFIHAR